MNKKFFRLSALALAMLLCLTAIPACSTDSGDKVKVGLIAPMTGDVAVYGNAVMEAVELYIDEFNKAGGVNGKDIKLIKYDDKGDATEALNAYNKLVSSDKVVAFIGPVTSTPTFGVAQKSVDDNIPGITGTATHPDVTTYGDNYFRACFEDPFQGGAITTFASDYLKATKGAIIYNTGDTYSTGLKDSITAKAGELGLEITATEGYAKGDTDFNSQLTNIIATNPEVLFIPDYYNTAYLICKQARDLGFKGTFCGVDGADGILEIEGVDVSYVNGMYFSNHYSTDSTSETVQNFIKAYTAKYGEDKIPNALAALGYDAARILCSALVEVDKSGVVLSNTAESYQAVIDAMMKTDLDCVTGHITFDENNNPIKDCTIIGIKDGKNTYIANY